MYDTKRQKSHRNVIYKLIISVYVQVCVVQGLFFLICLIIINCYNSQVSKVCLHYHI